MMTFAISLLQTAPIVASKGERLYDQELDNLTSLLTDICEVMAEKAHLRFIVAGFGQDPWPVDVRVDLPVVVEQVPAALRALHCGANMNLGFYEQGIQRVLEAKSGGSDDIVLECQSMTSWRPVPSTITMKRQELLALLESFLAQFVGLARKSCPAMVEHAWFREWASDERLLTGTSAS